MSHQLTLSSSIVAALETAEPYKKANATRQIVAAWRAKQITELGQTRPPNRPARPAKPTLLPPAVYHAAALPQAPQGVSHFFMRLPT